MTEGNDTTKAKLNTEYQREYYLKHREKKLEYQREYREKHKEDIAEKHRIYCQRNREAVAAYHRQYKQRNKEAILENQKQYNQRNREAKTAYRRAYQQANKKRLAVKKRQYYLANRSYIIQKTSEYQRVNPHIARVIRLRREARKRNLPNTYSANQWQLCLDYWHGCCAVCCNPLRDLFGEVEPNADHWIPLAHPSCPGTVPENMVCLCNSCNSSKKDTLPEVWLEIRFGNHKGKKIFRRIAEYLNWIKQQ